MTEPTRHLLLYDGVCALCNGVVKLLLAIDRRGRFSYAALQGETAAEVRQRHPTLGEDVDTVVWVACFGSDGETIHLRSDAVLGAVGAVGGGWRAVVVLRAVPRFLRDAVYDFVARHRYRWFGRYDACPLPPSGVRHRFLP